MSKDTRQVDDLLKEWNNGETNEAISGGRRRLGVFVDRVVTSLEDADSNLLHAIDEAEDLGEDSFKPMIKWAKEQRGIITKILNKAKEFTL